MYHDIFAEISQNLTIFLIKMTIQSLNDYYLTTFKNVFLKTCIFYDLIKLVMLG